MKYTSKIIEYAQRRFTQLTTLFFNNKLKYFLVSTELSAEAERESNWKFSKWDRVAAIVVNEILLAILFDSQTL